MNYLTEYKTNKYNIDKILYLLIDRPCTYGAYTCWVNNEGEYHRDYNLPAVVITVKTPKQYADYTYWHFYINGEKQ